MSTDNINLPSDELALEHHRAKAKKIRDREEVVRKALSGYDQVRDDVELSTRATLHELELDCRDLREEHEELRGHLIDGRSLAPYETVLAPESTAPAAEPAVTQSTLSAEPSEAILVEVPSETVNVNPAPPVILVPVQTPPPVEPPENWVATEHTAEQPQVPVTRRCRWGLLAWVLALILAVVGLLISCSWTSLFDKFSGFGHGLVITLWVILWTASGFCIGGSIGSLDG